MKTDPELLLAYLTGDPTAFESLMRRYLNLVHAAARRQAPSHADDVTQAVFLLLHKKAPSLTRRSSLAGWLFLATRLCATNALRAEGRRRAHEQEAGMLRQNTEGPSDATRMALLSQLDDALASLRPGERELILQHHMQKRPLAEVASLLGISVPAVTKRTQRAMERLRGWFAAAGHPESTSAITAVLLEEASRQAPPALVQSHATVSAVTLAKSAGAVTLATGIKAGAVAAGISIFVGIGFWAVSTPAPASPAVPALVPASLAPRDEAAIVGTTRLARMEMFVDRGAAERLKIAGKVVETTSKRYTVYRAENDALIDALRVEKVGNGLYLGPTLANFVLETQPTPQSQRLAPPLYARVAARRDGVAMSASLSVRGGAYHWELAGDGVRMSLNAPEITFQLRSPEDGANLPPVQALIGFDGNISPGQSVFFVGDAGTIGPHGLAHLVIWQAFKLADAEAAFLASHGESMREPGFWIDHGPDPLRQNIDRALVWRSRAPEHKLPAFTRTLPNGATISLIAVGVPRTMPWYWWQPDGQPAERDWVGYEAPVDSGGALVFDLKSPSLPMKERPKFGYSGDGYDLRYYPTNNREIPWPADTIPESVEVGVGVGPWTDVGTIPFTGGMLEKDGAVVEITGIKDFNERGRTYPSGQYQSPPETELRVIAEAKNGDRRTSSGEAIGWPSITVGKTSADTVRRLILPLEIESQEVARFVVQTRKREWTVFQGIATAPVQELPTSVTEQERTAALEILARRAEVATQQLAEAKRLEVEKRLREADLTTPQGAHVAVLARARAGDLQGLAACYVPQDSPVVQGGCARLIAQEALRAAAEKRFGRETVSRELLRYPNYLLPDEESRLGIYWDIRGDEAFIKSLSPVATTRPSLPALIRRGEKWLVDASRATGDGQQMLQQARLYDHLRERLEKNEFGTIDALAAGLREARRAATRPVVPPAHQ